MLLDQDFKREKRKEEYIGMEDYEQEEDCPINVIHSDRSWGFKDSDVKYDRKKRDVFVCEG